MQKIKDILHIVLRLGLLAIIGIAIYFVYRLVDWGERVVSKFENHTEAKEAIAPPKDTATTKHITLITTNNNTHNYYPYQVEKQASLDTNLRKQVATGTIVTGLKFENGKLHEQKIDSTGKLTQSDFKISPTDKIDIDKTGQISVIEDKKAARKEKLRKTGNKLLMGGSFIAGFIIGRASK